MTATYADGSVQEGSISVIATLSEHHIELAAAIEAGSSPLEGGTWRIVNF